MGPNVRAGILDLPAQGFRLVDLALRRLKNYTSIRET